MSLFLCLSAFPLGRFCRKSFTKSGEFGKKIKRGGWPCKGRVVYRMRVSLIVTVAFPDKITPVIDLSDEPAV